MFFEEEEKSTEETVEETTEETKTETQEETTEEKTGTEETQKEESSTSETETSEKDKLDYKTLYEEEKSKAEKAEHGIEQLTKRVDSLTYKVKTNEQSGKEKTWDDLDVDQLKDYRTHYRKEGNDEMVDFLNDKIVDRKSEQVADGKFQLQANNKARIDAWSKVKVDYPELADTSSEHYKKTLALIQARPELNNVMLIPDGHAAAARIVAEEIMRQKLHGKDTQIKATKNKLSKSQAKLGLESGTQKAVASKSSMEKLLKTAVDSNNPYGIEWRNYWKAKDKIKKD